jgi:hypothetical protein
MKKAEKQQELEKLLDAKERMEKGIILDGKFDPELKRIVATWQQYSGLKQEQKDLLKQDWDAYFRMVQETRAAKRFAAQGKAWKSDNMKLVKGYGEKAKEQQKNQDWELPTPALEDPLFLENSQITIHYRYLIGKINELQKEGSDYATLGF